MAHFFINCRSIPFHFCIFKPLYLFIQKSELNKRNLKVLSLKKNYFLFHCNLYILLSQCLAYRLKKNTIILLHYILKCKRKNTIGSP